MTDKKKIGNKGEELAAEFLEKINYKIIEKNYRFGKGEIDIVCEDPNNKNLVFVEVKSRTNLNFGDPIYALTKRKMVQLRKIADAYIYEKKIDNIDCRFDVVTILYKPKEKPDIKHYINAF
ncbi:MAG: YraN family protein [Ignavibacteriales bacterium CG12_big_fil_rev_8_21_14_0_65_30_8]|nr:MAG: YraN family protein [Ignavibacteriales bacterium CG12_big_fil_rev_8_21_14_0_65_30_8]